MTNIIAPPKPYSYRKDISSLIEVLHRFSAYDLLVRSIGKYWAFEVHKYRINSAD